MSRKIKKTGYILLSLLAVMPDSSAFAVDYVTTLTYDLNGNVNMVTSPSGGMMSYTRDFADRVTMVSYQKAGLSSQTVAYTYDGNDNRTSMTDATGKTSYGYDRFNRLVGVQRPGLVPTYYDYDKVGRVTMMTYPSGSTMAYEYDGAGRLISATVNGQYVTRYTYDDQNNTLWTKTLPNGLMTTYTYDNDNRIKTAVNNTVSGELWYDGNGNITNSTIGSTTQYTYNALNALVNAVSGGRAEGYTYDESGNRILRTGSDGTTSYEYDGDNRLAHSWGAMSNTVYFYGADGSLTTKATNDRVATFTYDATGRLVGWNDGTTDVDFAYDGDGNRGRQFPRWGVGPDACGSQTKTHSWQPMGAEAVPQD